MATPDQIKGLFDRALELPVSDRESFVRSEAEGDEELMAEVLGLLEHASEGTTQTGPIREDRRSGIPDRIGHFKILGVLGEGGFGVVYEAEQTEPVKRRVALKVIKPGMDSKAILARFEAERQALAIMNHPNIARVFEAGQTERGLPYFAMELVRGSPITEYCDRQRLTVEDRLKLAAQVCDAIQHAHTKAIIHRDIKPSNVMVVVSESGEPTTKVIDFGIAKAMSQPLTERTIFTEQGQMIGTPEYMSPEQAEMDAEDIDTRSDVYSLGVLLYELLAGQRPFDLKKRALGEIQRIIRDEDPPRPSTRLSSSGDSATDIAEHRRTDARELAGRLRKELEWIPLKALRKDRTERYGSAADLGADIRRYLAGEALEAGPESASYKARKFVRRNKGPVTAAGVVFAVLVLGVVGTSLGFMRAAERAEGERAAKEEAVDKQRIAEAAVLDRDEALEAEREQRALVERARAKREDANYTMGIRLAASRLGRREFGLAAQALESCDPDRRGWEWDWLSAQSDSSLMNLSDHTRWVSAASFSPDGARIVTASYDSTARVWDAVTGESLSELTGHTDWVRSASFSPDGSRIVTASRDGTARVWDATTYEDLAELSKQGEKVSSAEFSPDGVRIVTVMEGDTAWVWDATTGEILAELTGHTDRVWDAWFSPGGSRIVTSSNDETARVWDAITGESLAVLAGNDGVVLSALFSPDGSRIVTASDDGAVRVWDTSSGEMIDELIRDTSGEIFALFSPDGTRIVTISFNDAVRVWDAVKGESLFELTGHTDWVRSASFSPDGSRIVTASGDGTARVWDAFSGETVAELIGHASTVVSAVFSPDGTRIVTASNDRTAKVWDARGGSAVIELVGHTKTIRAVSFSPDGTRAVTASIDETARVWDTLSGGVLAEFRGHADGLLKADFSPDGHRIVTASIDGTARVWDASRGTGVAELAGHLGDVSLASFSPDGSQIVTASRDGTARVWDASDGSEVAELMVQSEGFVLASFSPDGTRIVTVSTDGVMEVWDPSEGSDVIGEIWQHQRIRAAGISPDGTRLVTALEGGRLRVWDVMSGTVFMELVGRAGFVNSVEFSPDGTRIVTASDDGMARVWDVLSGSMVAELSGHTDEVFSASFSPDVARVVTASFDGTACVWDASNGLVLVELAGHNGKVVSASFSPDGTRIVTASIDGTARVWDSVPYRERFGEIQRTREAAAKMEKIVSGHLAGGRSLDEIRDELLGDPDLSFDDRTGAQIAIMREREAARVAEREREAAARKEMRAREAKAANRHGIAWALVSFTPTEPVDPDHAASGLRLARETVQFVPDNGVYLKTLGVALYRAAEYEEALETLLRSDELNRSDIGEQTADVAFIAMTRWQLGQHDEARAGLDRLRELAAMEAWGEDEETIRWVEEAEALITPVAESADTTDESVVPEPVIAEPVSADGP